MTGHNGPRRYQARPTPTGGWAVHGDPIDTLDTWPLITQFETRSEADAYIATVTRRQRDQIHDDRIWRLNHHYRGGR